MARTPSVAAPSAPKTPAAYIPKPTDARAELFYLLGTLNGRFESANRIVELVIDLTAPPEPTEAQ